MEIAATLGQSVEPGITAMSFPTRRLVIVDMPAHLTSVKQAYRILLVSL